MFLSLCEWNLGTGETAIGLLCVLLLPVGIFCQAFTENAFCLVHLTCDACLDFGPLRPKVVAVSYHLGARGAQRVAVCK